MAFTPVPFKRIFRNPKLLSLPDKLSRFLVIVLLGANIYIYSAVIQHCSSAEHISSKNRSANSPFEQSGHSFYYDLPEFYRIAERLQPQIDKELGVRTKVVGNIAWYPTQIHYYARAASQNWVRNICEVGYGVGHSTLLYLTVNRQAKLYSFDWFSPELEKMVTGLAPSNSRRDGKNPSIEYIVSKKNLINRFHMVRGDSNNTIPMFTKRETTLKCDLISIDGSHISPQPYFDILHFRPLAHHETLVILDDMHSSPVRNDLDRAISEKILAEIECLKPEQQTDRKSVV